MSRFARTGGAWCLPLIVAGIAGIAAGLAASEGAAVEAVAASLDVERVLLREDLERREAQSRRREAATNRTVAVERALDALLAREQVTREPLDRLLTELEQAEADRATVLAAEQTLLERIRDRLRRIELLEAEIEELRGRQEREVAGTLNGTWAITLLPVEQRGSCLLQQNGTLVTGTYRLEGGMNGSLQGTLVNRKVFLVRIDSKLGKSMELEGYLSSDGKYIRGSWLSYELAGQEGGTGQWSAVRRAASAHDSEP